MLQQFKRKRPAHFSFVADTEEHPGIRGIEVRRDVTMGALPRFECRIEGKTVRLDSTGTPGLKVNLGAGGLGVVALAQHHQRIAQAGEAQADAALDRPGDWIVGLFNRPWSERGAGL